MTHDPMCPSAYTFMVCECPLIARVRADERTIMPIQRYVVDESYLASRLIVGEKKYEATVDVVLYADHVAALDEQRDTMRVHGQPCTESYDVGYEAGRDAALTLARDAVAAWMDKRKGHDFRTCDDYDHDCYLFRGALAAIDALAPDPHRAHREDGVQWCEDCADDTDDRPTPCELHRARGQRWCRDCYADAEAEARGDREREGR